MEHLLYFESEQGQVMLTNFLDISLNNSHLFKLARNLLFNAFEQKMAFHVLEPLLLTHSLLLPHQEVQVANVGAVGE